MMWLILALVIVIALSIPESRAILAGLLFLAAYLGMWLVLIVVVLIGLVLVFG